MLKFRLVSGHDATNLSSPPSVGALHATSAQVAYDHRTNEAIVMKIEAMNVPEPLFLVLSPPAARQLSRALHQAVKDYLNSSPEETQ